MQTEYDLFPGANLGTAVACDPQRSRAIVSSEIIAYLELRTRYDRAAAARVVDGFWVYIADIRAHYTDRGNCWLLVIPHFGTFTYRSWPGLVFRSARLPLLARSKKGHFFSRLFGAKPSAPDDGPELPTSAGVTGSWCRRQIHHPGGLSVKRRMAFTIAQTSGISLEAVAEILEELFLALLVIFQRVDTMVVWSGRGTMKPVRSVGKCNPRTMAPVPDRFRYRFRASKRFFKRLRHP